MHLVDDVDAVFADLGRDADHVGEVADIVHRVVGSRVELMDTVGAALGEGQAGLALAAGLHVRSRVETVDGLCEDPGGSGLAHSAGTAEEIGMGELSAHDGVLQGPRDILLADKRLKCVGPVFPG